MAFKPFFHSLYLDDESFVSEAWGQSELAHVGRLVDEVLDAVENSTPGGWYSAVDSSLADGLPSHAGMSINVLYRDKHTMHVNIQGINTENRMYETWTTKFTVVHMNT